ncbi:Hypothetical predicted protein [Cloeon dipterum]|uniref:Helitron helicase-like domain-containing protein n=1 Tax=Cloeon dipterum TaxID=197152 RepID=A0A8S1E442_9INSE|nr:Hypothetical predicted protein [Cloeon dipterum]
MDTVYKSLRRRNRPLPYFSYIDEIAQAMSTEERLMYMSNESMENLSHCIFFMLGPFRTSQVGEIIGMSAVLALLQGEFPRGRFPGAGIVDTHVYCIRKMHAKAISQYNISYKFSSLPLPKKPSTPSLALMQALQKVELSPTKRSQIPDGDDDTSPAKTAKRGDQMDVLEPGPRRTLFGDEFDHDALEDAVKIAEKSPRKFGSKVVRAASDDDAQQPAEMVIPAETDVFTETSGSDAQIQDPNLQVPLVTDADKMLVLSVDTPVVDANPTDRNCPDENMVTTCEGQSNDIVLYSSPSSSDDDGSVYQPETDSDNSLSDSVDDELPIYQPPAYRNMPVPPEYVGTKTADKWTYARNNGFLFAARGDPDPQIAVYFHAGDFSVECPVCGALFFEKEADELQTWPNGAFGPCCSHGQALIPAVPQREGVLKELFENTHPLSREFKKNIVTYSNTFALCGFSTKVLGYNTWPFVYRIQGQIYTPISPAYERLLHNPETPDEPSYVEAWEGQRRNAECRFVDTEKAVSLMAQTSPRADPHLLLLVEEELRATNPFIIAYKTMGEVWRELVHKSLQENTERPKDLVMLLSKAGDPMVALGPNQEILEPITRTEFAAIYNGEVAPQSPTHVVYMRGRVHNMPLQSEFTFPFLFPLLFPHGTIIWRPQMQLTPVIRPGGRRPRNAAAIPPAPPAAADDLPPGILADAVNDDDGDDNDDNDRPPPPPNVAPRHRQRYTR